MSSVGETRSGNFFLPLHCKAAFCAESYMILLGSRSLPFINLWDQNCDFFYFKHGGGREKRERVLVAVFEPPSRGLPARSRGILTLKTKVIIQFFLNKFLGFLKYPFFSSIKEGKIINLKNAFKGELMILPSGDAHISPPPEQKLLSSYEPERLKRPLVLIQIGQHFLACFSVNMRRPS